MRGREAQPWVARAPAFAGDDGGGHEEGRRLLGMAFLTGEEGGKARLCAVKGGIGWM